MSFYKGYIPTNGKAAKVKFKDAKLMSLDDVKESESYAGVLSDDTILIDVDDKEQSELLLKIIEDRDIICRVIKTTRGMHFLFKTTEEFKCQTDIMLACGIKNVDVKYGTAYEVLKLNGEERKVIYDALDGEQYNYLPEYFYPVKLRNKVDFTLMSEGDGRNEELFKYVSRLQEQGISNEGIREACVILNNYIFDTPLDEKEFDTVLRDERFEHPVFFVKGVFQFDVFSKFLADQNNMVLINNDLYTFDGSVYTNSQKVIERQMIKLIPKLTHSMRNEILYYLQLLVKDHEETNCNLIAFDNGVYNIKTRELMMFSQSHIVTNKLPVYYDENAYNGDVDKALDSMTCGNKQLRRLLEEAVGYCFYRRNEIRKAFVLIGKRHNGKSTFLTMLQKLVGYDNYCALDLKELNDRFKSSQLCNKLVNIGDDIEDDYIPNVATFKKLVTGNPINVERKGQDPFDFKNYAKFMLSANEMPKMKDKTGAVIDRLIMIPFNATFKPGVEGYDPELIDKITTPSALSYLALLGIKALEGVLERKEFTKVDVVDTMIKEYEVENNPTLQFIEDEGVQNIVNQPTSDIYLRYSTFCSENGYKALSKSAFSKTINRVTGLTTVTRTIRGKSVRIFVKKNE